MKESATSHTQEAQDPFYVTLCNCSYAEAINRHLAEGCNAGKFWSNLENLTCSEIELGPSDCESDVQPSDHRRWYKNPTCNYSLRFCESESSPHSVWQGGARIATQTDRPTGGGGGVVVAHQKGGNGGLRLL